MGSSAFQSAFEGAIYDMRISAPPDATLLGRARRCKSERHHVPNLIAVDFYKRGELLRVAGTLNGV